jgi:hypothetical protein
LGKMGDDYIDAKLDKLVSELLGTIASRLGIAELDLDVLAFRIAEGVQTAPESISERLLVTDRVTIRSNGQLRETVLVRAVLAHGTKASQVFSAPAARSERHHSIGPADRRRGVEGTAAAPPHSKSAPRRDIRVDALTPDTLRDWLSELAAIRSDD